VSKLTELERAASRRVVATVRSCGFLGGSGLSMWREALAGRWKASAEELAADLQALGVTCAVVEAWRPPSAGDPAGRVRRGREVRVARGDLPALVARMPSLAGPVGDLAQTQGSGLCALRAEAEAVAVVRLPLAADWPTWTPAQAQAVGLSCRVCGHDLRGGGPARRVAYLSGPVTARGALTLTCGPCLPPVRDGVAAAAV